MSFRLLIARLKVFFVACVRNSGVFWVGAGDEYLLEGARGLTVGCLARAHACVYFAESFLAAPQS